MYRQLSINPDSGERLDYNVPGFSVRSVTGNLYYFHNFSAGCHWHNDFEFLIADQGDIEYFVNGKTLYIPEGSGIFINANRLHYGFSSRQQDCSYTVLVFHPDIFTLPASQYARDMGADRFPDYLLLTDCSTLALIRQIYKLFQQQEECFELQVLACCADLTFRIRKLMGEETASMTLDADWIALRRMIGYIQDFYANAIRLEDIAAAGAVCRSKCCTLFQEKLSISPIAYLNRYRMEKARNLLLSSQAPITQIAHQCGFDSPSYFSEMFRKTYGESPRAVRNHAK